MEKKDINILVACEESQTITKALRDQGYTNSFSCDLLPCSGGYKHWHFKGNVFDLFNLKKDQNKPLTPGGLLENGEKFYFNEQIHLMIAHPPCTYLAVSGARWFHDPRPKYKGRLIEQKKAIEFVEALWDLPIRNIVIENPVGVLSTKSIILKKPSQIVQPWMFGDEATKKTCFWIKGEDITTLKIDPEAETSNHGEVTTFKSGKSQPKWYSDALIKAKTPEERRTLRSKTFPKMARAISKQWADQVLNSINLNNKQRAY